MNRIARIAFVAAGVLAAATLSPGQALAQGKGWSITIGPKGVELAVPDHERKRPGYRRCLPRYDLDRVIAYQGWRDLRNWSSRRNVVYVNGRQWGAHYALEFDECSGQLLAARRLDFDRGYWR
jgi:hypothetical protein